MKSALAIALLVSAYLSLWPVELQPVAWEAPQNPGYQGAFTPNTALDGLEQLEIAGEHGPEDIVQDKDGNLYTAVKSGWILRKDKGSTEFQRWVNTEGRPLGMDFDSLGNLVIADAFRGLLSVAPDKTLTVLTDTVNNTPILYADDVDIAPNGKMYFSDASTRFGAKDYGGTYEASLMDMMEHSRSGRVLVYNPADKTTSVVMEGLSFANGVAMDPQGRFFLVNETGEYRVHKFWLKGGKAGSSEVIFDNLPGFPDNIVTGHNGRFWLGLVSPRVDVADWLADKPWLRTVVQRLPSFVQPGAKRYSHVVAIDENGSVQHSLQDPSGQFAFTTGALEADDGYLYISSLMENRAARLPLEAALSDSIQQ
ncbi:SMP-30/gluconolactonase/LRE family protein [Parendozoicomonas haliclonae]|uniref:Strictosidine synthase n=1 Tax=Parendozoicomonas haliclonae TaxID=1960125 RepID=A0A1X7ARG1_9GAMM|nr:SMP-30/gluconolactonase/LRE family protein [Parendozoicomonas haliclonae]SMA50678.1 Strictosidine synthase [Parendozoicomonas haliclonae]